jgi:hypothetical protein
LLAGGGKLFIRSIVNINNIHSIIFINGIFASLLKLETARAIKDVWLPLGPLAQCLEFVPFKFLDKIID